MTSEAAAVEPRHEWHALASGVELHAVHWDPASPGTDEAVPFLLVHGLASNARLWDGVAQHLADADTEWSLSTSAATDSLRNPTTATT